jgi:hypothetical protein
MLILEKNGRFDLGTYVGNRLIAIRHLCKAPARAD